MYYMMGVVISHKKQEIHATHKNVDMESKLFPIKIIFLLLPLYALKPLSYSISIFLNKIFWMH